MIVVDASVAAKWLLREEGSDEATKLLADTSVELVAPDLLLPEVAGAVVRRANRGEASAADALATLDRWTLLLGTGRIGLRTMSAALVDAAGRLAIGIRHPIKDCVYLALAIESGAILVTSDAGLIEKGKQVYAGICSLNDIRSEDPVR